MKLVTILFTLTFTTNVSLAATTNYDTIDSVIEAFQQSITSKNKEKFELLFVDPSMTMLAVVSEESMVQRRAAVKKINERDNKNFTATKTWTWSPAKMIDRIVNETAISEEEFKNVQILSDDNIADVYFDYVFYRDKKPYTF